MTNDIPEAVAGELVEHAAMKGQPNCKICNGTGTIHKPYGGAECPECLPLSGAIVGAVGGVIGFAGHWPDCFKVSREEFNSLMRRHV